MPLEKVLSGIIMHGCNAQGVMNAGVAKALKEAHPEIFADYRRCFLERGLTLGQVVWTQKKPDLWIASAITQEFYGRKPGVRYVSYEAIEKSALHVAQKARETELPIHMPCIGAGLGGGNWLKIKPIFEFAFKELDWHIYTLEPQSAYSAETPKKPR